MLESGFVSADTFRGGGQVEQWCWLGSRGERERGQSWAAPEWKRALRGSIPLHTWPAKKTRAILLDKRPPRSSTERSCGSSRSKRRTCLPYQRDGKSQ